MREFELGETSAVTSPAQTGATAAIAKKREGTTKNNAVRGLVAELFNSLPSDEVVAAATDASLANIYSMAYDALIQMGHSPQEALTLLAARASELSRRVANMADGAAPQLTETPPTATLGSDLPRHAGSPAVKGSSNMQISKAAANAKLDELAKSHAQKHDANYYDAYRAVCDLYPDIANVAIAGPAPDVRHVAVKQQPSGLSKSQATAKLNEMTQRHATENQMDYFDAYDVVAKANPVLLSAAVG